MVTKQKLQKLPAGLYVKKSDVFNYVYDKMYYTLASIMAKVVRTYTVNDEDFYLVEDVKQIMAKDLFEKMECTVFNLIDIMTTANVIIALIKYHSNLDHCQSADDMQQALEKINDLLEQEFPDIPEFIEEEI